MSNERWAEELLIIFESHVYRRTAPTIRCIASSLTKKTSGNTVYHDLQDMKSEGYIDFNTGKCRTYEVTNVGIRFLCQQGYRKRVLRMISYAISDLEELCTAVDREN